MSLRSKRGLRVGFVVAEVVEECVEQSGAACRDQVKRRGTRAVPIPGLEVVFSTNHFHIK